MPPVAFLLFYNSSTPDGKNAWSLARYPVQIQDVYTLFPRLCGEDQVLKDVETYQEQSVWCLRRVRRYFSSINGDRQRPVEYAPQKLFSSGFFISPSAEIWYPAPPINPAGQFRKNLPLYFSGSQSEYQWRPLQTTADTRSLRSILSSEEVLLLSPDLCQRCGTLTGYARALVQTGNPVHSPLVVRQTK